MIQTVEANVYLKEKTFLEKNITLEILSKLKEIDCYIAGGALTSVFSSSKISDYDIYFKTKEDCKQLKIFFNGLERDNGSLYGIAVETENVVSYKIDNVIYQLIKLDELMGDIESILSKFDFRICMAAYSCKNQKFYMDDNFLYDLAKKELIYNIGEFPIATLFRLRKFLYKGFKISGCEIIKLGLTINNLKIETYKQLKRQLIGIDTLFLKDLISVIDGQNYINKQYDFKAFLIMMDNHIQTKYAQILEEEKE